MLLKHRGSPKGVLLNYHFKVTKKGYKKVENKRRKGLILIISNLLGYIIRMHHENILL